MREDSSLLDNPIWHALSSTHARFAESVDGAKRYPLAVTPLAATAEFADAAYTSLGKLIRPGEMAGLFLDQPPVLPPGLSTVRVQPLTQMAWNSGQAAPEYPFEQLSSSNVDEMLELVELTKPGPFGRRTPELGIYMGIRHAGRLVAMAGERLRMPGYTEISAVCTHPDHRSRGYAASLVSSLIRQITERGDIPFLHVASENIGAIRVYEKLGFTTRRTGNVIVVKRDAV